VNDPNKITGSEAKPAEPGTTSLSLVEEVRARDPEAWRRLAYLYGPLVYSWCRHQGLPGQDAEDVVQEVFLTVFARVSDFRREREGDTFRGWLWTIARHKIGDWIRRHGRQPQAAGGTDAQEQLLETAAAGGSESEGRPGLNRPLSKVAALQEAKQWLRQLTDEEVAQLQAQFPKEARGQIHLGGAGASSAWGYPFEHPYYWSAFILIGDPGERTDEEGRWLDSRSRAPAPAEPFAPLCGLLLVLAGLAVGQFLRRRGAAANTVWGSMHSSGGSLDLGAALEEVADDPGADAAVTAGEENVHEMPLREAAGL